MQCLFHYMHTSEHSFIFGSGFCEVHLFSTTVLLSTVKMQSTSGMDAKSVE